MNDYMTYAIFVMCMVMLLLALDPLVGPSVIGSKADNLVLTTFCYE